MDTALPIIAAFVGNTGSTPARPRVAISKPVMARATLENVRVRVVVFSKDRPFQLLCLLRSIRAHVVGAEVDIVVIWRADDATLYQPVADEFGTTVTLLREGPDGDFRSLATAACVGPERRARFVLMCVDDAFM